MFCVSIDFNARANKIKSPVIVVGNTSKETVVELPRVALIEKKCW